MTGTGRSATLTQTREAVTKAVEADREKIRLAEVAIAKAQEAKLEAAAFEAAGGDSAQAQKQVEAAEATISRQRHAIQHIEAVIAQRENHLAEDEERAEAAEVEDASRALARACEEQRIASKTFAANVSRCAKSETELRAKRRAYDEALARVEEVADTVELPASADEEDWPDLKAIAETIKGGPRQPIADEERRAERAVRERKHADHSLIVDGVRRALGGGFGSAFAECGRLAERSWEAFWIAYQAELRRWVERRLAESGGQVPAGAPAAIRRAEEFLARDVADLVAETAARKLDRSRQEVLA